MFEEQPPEFEDHLRAFLAHAAEAIPPDADVSARVRQALASPPHHHRLFSIAGPRNVLATIAAALVVALLAATLAFVHPGGLPRPGAKSNRPTDTATTAPMPAITPRTCDPRSGGVANPPQPAGTPVDRSVAIGRSASAQGITITVDRVYSDATETIVTYHMQTNINPPLPDIAVLVDAQGRRYGSIIGDWDISRGAYYVFAPLPFDELRTPQTLTFLVQQMRLANPTGPGALEDGPWSVSFVVTPTAGTHATLSNPAVVDNGLSVQPLQLDVAPAGGGRVGATGGARIIVRLSGLPPSMPLSDLKYFETAAGPGGSVPGCQGMILELILPNGQQIAPGSVLLLGQTVPETSAEADAAQGLTVGPSGTVDLEALFYTPIQSTAGLTFYMGRQSNLTGGYLWEFPLVPSA